MSDRVARIFDNNLPPSVIVPGNRVVRSAEVAHVGGRPDSTNPKPTIELVSEGNVVRAIDVTCACGQKMRIWCSYDVDADQAGKADAA
jgi:hypothetical protein